MTAATVVELPIFPLHTVLFPAGVLPLKIFEQRYLEMVGGCMKDDKPFGVCLIAEGGEVGAPAVPHDVGVTARIVEWDMPQLGVLNVVTRGQNRFRIVHREVSRQGVVMAHAVLLPGEPDARVPESLQTLLPLLRAIAADVGLERMPEPHAFDDATWVGHRYAEVLPIPLIARQKLLELDDAIVRLEIISQYLAQHGLLG